jgi:serine/threonine-protein kinase
MGAAYLAEHEALPHIKCVIKLVLAELARHPMAISRVQTETEAVSLLRHDGIVKLQNFGVLDDGQLFSRFEFIDGVPLDRYVTEQGGILPVRKAAYVIFQLCDALQYAHDSGVIHRDLKPDNVMVEMNPKGSHLTVRVKILDFGIAKVIATTKEHTASGVAMGTPRYMAPEQVTNAASATGRADVFSMAVIFYLIVTGKLPWGAPRERHCHLPQAEDRGAGLARRGVDAR